MSYGTLSPLSGFGLGLRAAHYDAILAGNPPVDWFEFISENFMEAHPGHWEFLGDLRERYPLVMHGVGLNIGSTDPLNQAYLTKLRSLAEHVRPSIISDHLCWTGTHGINSHDLLPVPYTQASLNHMTDRIRQVQDVLGRRITLENPSTYAEFKASTLPEWEFIAQLAEASDCNLLLDVNNVYVSAFNHRYDAQRYIDALPFERILYIHLAGHLHRGTHIIDTHDSHVTEEVLELYRYTIRQLGATATMVEWDDNIPEWNVLLAELDKARAVQRDALQGYAA